MIDIFKAILLGIIEGITEWLPVSSTGHLILADEFIKINASEEFKTMFDVVIQFAAIIAVIVLFFDKLWPFCINRNETTLINKYCKKDVWHMWFKVLVAVLPAMVIGLPLDNWMTENLHNAFVVGAMLILYGIAFIVVESKYKNRQNALTKVSEITYKLAFGIGMFQVLSLVPGTSRSGATIIGALILGLSRTLAAEFTFFLAIPVMAGASLIKLLNFGFYFTAMEVAILATGMITSFIVSMISINFLMNYVKNHDFKVFGIYRIALGAVVLIYFSIVGI